MAKRTKRMRRRYFSNTWAGNSSLVNTGPTGPSRKALAQYHQRVQSTRGPRNSKMPVLDNTFTHEYPISLFPRATINLIAQGIKPNVLDPVIPRARVLEQLVLIRKAEPKSLTMQPKLQEYKPIRLSPKEDVWKITTMYFCGEWAFLIEEQPDRFMLRRSINYSVASAKAAYTKHNITWIKTAYYIPPD